MSQLKSIGIVGAGASGLACAKHMLEEGWDVTLYEIGSHVGGMWVYNNDNERSSAYRTLHINTARDLTSFSDYPFDPSVQPFPSHWDMAKYLKDYGAHFGITKRVRAVRLQAEFAERHSHIFTEIREPHGRDFDRLVQAAHA